MAPQFVGFPDIQLLHNVIRMCDTYPDLNPGPVKYRGKLKMHGCNAGITIKDGEFVAQSRTRVITPEDDYAGFARWAHTHAEYWKSRNDMTVFGEWCGPGVVKSKGTAISKIPNKVFAVFAAVVNMGEDDADPASHMLFNSPAALSVLLEVDPAAGNPPEGIHILPWHGEMFTVDFSKKDELPALADRLNAELAVVEPSDPWVKKTFGVDGEAEGIVYYPHAGEDFTVGLFEHFAFKVKGEKHRVMKTKEAVQIDPEVAASIAEFVTMFVTEARCDQGAQAMTQPLNVRNTKNFIDWMSFDVKKESEAELEAAELTWEQVKPAVEAAARAWFIGKTKGAQ